MDDFVLLHRDKAYLRECLIHPKAMFKNELHLEFNSKTQVLPIKDGVNYLGWHLYLTEKGKVIRTLKTTSKKRIKRRFICMKSDYSRGALNLGDIKRRLASTRGHLIHGHTFALRKKLWGRLVLVRNHHTHPSRCKNTAEKLSH